jgi:DNA invertase Pin-like site-specific DNA recombinase
MRKRSFVKDPEPANKGLLLGYARISKGDEQNNALQARALRAAGCKRLFEEAASGGRWDRPELHRMLDHLREGDTVVVWKLDRLSRSLKDVLHIMERIAQAGAGFRSITESIDTTTPAGRMMMQMVGAFAEFERAIDPRAHLCRHRRRPRRGARRRPSQEARCREAPRDRRERYHRPQVRCRDGASLQYQPANRVTHRRPASDGQRVADR